MMSKTKLVLGVAASLTVAGALVSQPAVAGTKAQHHQREAALMSKVDIMESQLRAMQDEIASVRASQGVDQDAAKVQELDAWMQEQKAKPAREKDNMVFFRGGFARNDQRPHATTSNLNGDGCNISGAVDCNSSDKDGWYFGAGFDFSLDDDLFGLSKNTEVLGELMFDYVELGQFTGNVTGAPGFGAPGGIPNSASTATQSQLRLTAAPKIKFFKGSKLRPWIIPAGFTLNVMSPPSQANTITHLMPAMHFGGGVDYNIWRNLYVGADVRYTWAFNKLDSSVNVNGLQAGGYLGIGF
jgi:hypothetical protein